MVWLWLCCVAVHGGQTAAQPFEDSEQAQSQSPVVFDVPAILKCYPIADAAVHTMTTGLDLNASGRVADEVRPQEVPSGGLARDSGNVSRRTMAAFVSSQSLAPALDSPPPSDSAPPLADPPSQPFGVISASASQRFLLQVDASVLFADASNVQAVMFEIMPLSRAWRIVDFAPRSQSTSEFEGPIEWESKADHNSGLIGNVSGGIPGYADLSLHINGDKKQNSFTRQQLKAPQTAVVTSCISQRGSGAVFKFSSSREFLIEGGHRMELVFDAPGTWQGDIAEVHCRALTDTGSVTQNFLVAIHASDSPLATQLALKFADEDRVLQNLVLRWQHESSPANGPLSPWPQWLSKRNDPAPTVDVAVVRKTLRSATSLEQIPQANQLPPRIRIAAGNALATKRALLKLAQ